MPSSRASTIPYVISVIKQIKPVSILDVGIGFGKWGYLFREYTDIIESEIDPARYLKENWKIRIEGIEGFSTYLHEGHNYIYDKLYIGDALEIIPTLNRYDVIFFGDIIEHFQLETGKKLLQNAIEHCNKCILITTPKYNTNQGILLNNPLEKHQSVWTIGDFKSIGSCMITPTDKETYVVAYPVSNEMIFNLELEKGPPYPLGYIAILDLLKHIKMFFKSMFF